MRACVDTPEENSSFLSIDAEMNITCRVYVVEKNTPLFSKAFTECLGPVPWFIGEVWTGILGKGVS